MNRGVARAAKALRPVGSIDAVAGGRVKGWAFGPGRLGIEAWIDGKRIATAVPRETRRDVAVAYPRQRGALASGFSLELPADPSSAESLLEVRIVARPSMPWLPVSDLGTLQMAGPVFQEKLASAPASGLRSPFPRAVTDMVAAAWPEDCTELHLQDGRRRFVRRLKQLFATPGVSALTPLADYARYLRTTFAHCRFVEKHFPVANSKASAGAADYHCKPNSVRELFPIIHQLYVLRSYGIEGDFAEFGCFKGYSSAMLSFACQQLGIAMHIFDSFEGLPPAPGSGYIAGQYAGGLEEVRENVSRFGSIAPVEFHKGFFADTFREWRPPPLMCLWMDVDLEVSARDLMIVADRLDPRATVFSHECPATIFQGGEIVSPPSPNNPIAPMLARFEQMGRPLTGHYVAGFTGAFWPRKNGIPVLDTDTLFELVSDF